MATPEAAISLRHQRAPTSTEHAHPHPPHPTPAPGIPAPGTRGQAPALSKPPVQPGPASPPDAAPRGVAAPGASASPEHAAPEPQAPPLSEDRTREQVQPQAADGADMDGQAPAHPLFRPQSQVPGGPGAESAHDA